jgi:hydroxypyruvate reductase
LSKKRLIYGSASERIWALRVVLVEEDIHGSMRNSNVRYFIRNSRQQGIAEVHTMKPAIPPQTLLRQMFDAAIASAQPQHCLPAWLPDPPPGRTIAVGAGKASAAMAQVLERHWPGEISGLVVTRYGYAVPCRRIDVIEAGHPLPDEAGLEAARRVVAQVQGLTPDDLVIGLFSGGGSALLPMPLPEISLPEKQAITRQLLLSGAAIGDINCVRRHLSAIKGGRLAAACAPARVECLLISDVPGDHPLDIASGPMVGDPTTCRDAFEILRRHRIAIPPHIEQMLLNATAESVKPDDPRLARAHCRIIARPQMALEAAAELARAHGITPHIVSDRLEGEAAVLGCELARQAIHVVEGKGPVAPPCVLISGGETTVTVRGSGRGGRNVEFLLSLLCELHGRPGIFALAGDTDGVDGMEEIAGAVIGPDSLQRAASAGLDAQAMLRDNDAHSFFQLLSDSVVTGPTLTNVNDFRAILIAGE